MIISDIIDDDDDYVNVRDRTREWVKKREEKGAFNNIVYELRIQGSDTYKEMMRMTYDTFCVLLNYIEPYISPTERYFGTKVIKATERLVLTSRFIAIGESFKSLSYQFRISTNAISYIVKQVTEAIVTYVGKHFLKTPSSKSEWLTISNSFESKWNYPHCLGAIDGKHILITPPPESGSHYFNYKKSHSIILLARAGPDYECLYADVGSNGRMNDSGVWNKSTLHKKIESNEMDLPQPTVLPYGEKCSLYFRR